MTQATKEYVEARTAWVAARKNKTVADGDYERARYTYQLARAALRAEESELLEEKVRI